MEDIQNKFSKQEKLCSKISIDRIFAAGISFIAYPLRVVYYVEKENEPEYPQACVLISVSKRKFKRAVKRNRVKRLIREAYRLNKSELLSNLNRNAYHADIAFIYLKDELPTYLEIEKAMIKANKIISEKLAGEIE